MGIASLESAFASAWVAAFRTSGPAALHRVLLLGDQLADGHLVVVANELPTELGRHLAARDIRLLVGHFLSTVCTLTSIKVGRIITQKLKFKIAMK